MRDVTPLCNKRYVRIQPTDVAHSMLSTKYRYLHYHKTHYEKDTPVNTDRFLFLPLSFCFKLGEFAI